MIYFKNPVTSGGLKELLESGFSESRDNNTWYSFVPTFSDAECTIPECHTARRSFYDLVEICRTYFPDCTYKEVAQAIASIKDIICFLCPNIKKYVFLIYKRYGSNCFTKHSHYERDLETIDDFSFDDFLNLLNN